MRTTSASVGTPFASTILERNRVTVPLSVISRWISNQSRSSWSIEGSDLDLPSSAKNSSRFGYCALSSELYITAVPSPATWRTPPKSSPRLPRRCVSSASSSARRASLASNSVESCLLRASAAARARFASASSAACFSRSARNSCSRAALACAWRVRVFRVCSSSSSRSVAA
jgi:hypothetical protein